MTDFKFKYINIWYMVVKQWISNIVRGVLLFLADPSNLHEKPYHLFRKGILLKLTMWLIKLQLVFS